jgi:hypothetical protein
MLTFANPKLWQKPNPDLQDSKRQFENHAKGLTQVLANGSR